MVGRLDLQTDGGRLFPLWGKSCSHVGKPAPWMSREGFQSSLLMGGGCKGRTSLRIMGMTGLFTASFAVNRENIRRKYVALSMAWIHQHTHWPQFTWDMDALATSLAHVSHRQGLLLGKLGQLGFELQTEANLDMLTDEIVHSAAIEGERYNRPEVRSSLASQLVLPKLNSYLFKLALFPRYCVKKSSHSSLCSAFFPCPTKK
jgi:hypothetical protein